MSVNSHSRRERVQQDRIDVVLIITLLATRSGLKAYGAIEDFAQKYKKQKVDRKKHRDSFTK